MYLAGKTRAQLTDGEWDFLIANDKLICITDPKNWMVFYKTKSQGQFDNAMTRYGS